MTAASHTSGSLAALVNGKLHGPNGLQVNGLGTVLDAGPDQLTFIGDLLNAKRWGLSKAGTAVVTRGIEVPDHDPQSRALIEVESADLAMIAILDLFFKGDELPSGGIDASASISSSAVVHPSARIGPGVVIGERSTVAAGVSIHANTVLYADCAIGKDCLIHAGVVIRERSQLGERCIIGPNAVIGGDGFGYRSSSDGKGVLRVPHLGNVVLEDDVEVGCATTIDRGKFGATRVGRFTKIDNLCQIAHNVQIGSYCFISGCCGLAGSVHIGDGTHLGGGVGVAPHLTIGSGVRLAAYTPVMSDIPNGETWGGHPGQEIRGALREKAALRKLAAASKALLKLVAEP